MARIESYSLTTAAQWIDAGGPGKVLIYVTGDDVRMALNQTAVANEPYFTILDGTTIIFDQPQPFNHEPYFFRADSGTATLRLFVSGGGIQ